MRIFNLIFVFCFFKLSLAQNDTGIFQNIKDIGEPAIKGSAVYDEENQVYTLSGAGNNIWFDSDEFNYLYNEQDGDFIITANFRFLDEGGDPHRKTGIMIRESDDENAAHVSAVLHGDGLTSMQWRSALGEDMTESNEIKAPKYSYQTLQLERTGKKLIMRAAHWGEPLQKIGTRELENLSGKVLVGLFINSHNPELTEQASAWNVRIDKPVSDTYNPYEQGWLGCRLETIDIETGNRKVIFTKDDRFEAPNWMPNGEELLFNMDGSLYTIPVAGGKPSKLNTGFADNLNNDHGISFNGEMLAISHSPQGEGSAVYVLPLAGGEPQRVTEKTPSYWHGWAPNNREVVYVATRDGDPTYDIYKKDINGGEEVKLTNTKENEHVDGCEYSPDGKYIYYNGSASGSMQIWRMKPDGSDKEQITFDANNDWFPHISPDGKWIAYISFPAEIPVNDHPSFKRVTLNIIPADGGAPRVIAYLYGGQGTINVPSWSPDSKHFAFVSNSGSRKE
ncbi:DUF5050 domain-containing protein [Gramella sp. GC03-9]|uniref:DUF5050 domain-containing protein n=1 Tax=Christiangramia oceanisediminis TaxID=2920386 RepID=A0A9X2KVU2_9FLAO|nr:DUF5050 domain-containing protein [Gramella oceanisediminis]MCP9199557.1 DUF5050 domain-containing protein [Gramella oceanisediminis]